MIPTSSPKKKEALSIWKFTQPHIVLGDAELQQFKQKYNVSDSMSELPKISVQDRGLNCLEFDEMNPEYVGKNLSGKVVKIIRTNGDIYYRLVVGQLEVTISSEDESEFRDIEE